MRPAAFVVCLVAFAQLSSLNEVSGLTNAEFYDLIKDYITDVEVLDDETDYLQDESDDVINLPGGPDDVIDLEYIANKLGLITDDNHCETDVTDTENDNVEDTQLPDGLDNDLDRHYVADEHSLMHSDQVDFLRNRRRQFHRHHLRQRHLNQRHSNLRLRFRCRCRHYRCSCCLSHTFRLNLIFKRLRFRLNACVTVAYLRYNIGFEVTFTINRHRLFHREISLRNPPPLCFGVPGLSYFARVCLQFYNINLSSKRVCARLVGILDLWIKKFKVHLKLGCFKIPILDEQALTILLNDGDFLSACVKDSDDGREGVTVNLHDWLELVTSNMTSKETKAAMMFSRMP